MSAWLRPPGPFCRDYTSPEAERRAWEDYRIAALREVVERLEAALAASRSVASNEEPKPEAGRWLLVEHESIVGMWLHRRFATFEEARAAITFRGDRWGAQILDLDQP